MAAPWAMAHVDPWSSARGAVRAAPALPVLACLRALLALLALLALQASGCAASGPVAPATAAAAEPESGLKVLGRVCAPCHTSARTDRPILAEPGPSSEIASRALRAVMAREMPPTSAAALSDASRGALISFLCERAERPATYCQAIARAHAPGDRSPIRAAPTFFQSIKRVTAREVPDQVRDLAFLHTDPDASRVVLTPAGAALVIVTAAAVCAGDPASAAAPASAGANAADLGPCIRRVLLLGITPARPPAGSPARPTVPAP